MSRDNIWAYFPKPYSCQHERLWQEVSSHDRISINASRLQGRLDGWAETEYPAVKIIHILSSTVQFEAPSAKRCYYYKMAFLQSLIESSMKKERGGTGGFYERAEQFLDLAKYLLGTEFLLCFFKLILNFYK